MAENTDWSAESLDLYLSEVKWRRDDQEHRLDRMDQRLQTLFTLNFAVLAILGASLRIGDIDLPRIADYIAYSTFAVLVLNIAVLLFIYRVTALARRPDLPSLAAIMEQHEAEVARGWAAKEILLAIESNELRLYWKAKWVTRAMWSSSLGIVLVAVVSAFAIQGG